MYRRLFASVNLFHASHVREQRQIADGTVVNSQHRRALAVPVTNRLSTAGQPVVNRWSTAGFVPPPVYIGFPLFVLSKSRSREFSAVPWWRRRTDVCWASRTVEVPFGAAWPSFADAPPRPDPPVVCPGFGVGRFVFVNRFYAKHGRKF